MTRARRWLTIIVAGAVGIVVLVLVGFRGAAAWRERMPNRQAAPQTGQFLHSADVDLFVQEEGPRDGPPVLFIHGTGAWSEIWRGTMRAIAARGYRAIAVDMPPFGFSSRPNPPDYRDEAQARRILGLLDALRLEKVTLVGHSFGARPTVQATFLAGPKVRALVLVDAALGLSTSTNAAAPWPARAVLATPPLRDALVASTLTNPLLTRRLLRMLIAEQSAATPERITMLRRPFVIQETTVSFGQWLRPFVTDTDRSLATRRELYSSLRMPTLVIWGERDSLTPIEQGRDLVGLIPGAKWAQLPRAGHIPAIEDPDGFNAALIGFLTAEVRALPFPTAAP
jgi:pimeloyl-ACP methyl ester carboxylesterase